METDKAGGVSVMEPIGHAINKTKHILFDPFNLEKWFVIGFCAWLAGLAGGGGGFNFKAIIPPARQTIRPICTGSAKMSGPLCPNRCRG